MNTASLLPFISDESLLCVVAVVCTLVLLIWYKYEQRGKK